MSSETTPAEGRILDPVLHIIASSLDHPSLYMGGPSPQNVRKAERLVAALKHEGFAIQKEAANG